MRRRLQCLALAAGVTGMAGMAAFPAAASGGEAKETAGARFVRFETIIVSVLSDDSVRGNMEVALQLRVPDEMVRERVEKLRPRLIDAFTRCLVFFGQYYANVSRPVDTAMVTAELQKAADSVLGRGTGRVLVTLAAIRSG